MPLDMAAKNPIISGTCPKCGIAPMIKLLVRDGEDVTEKLECTRCHEISS